MTLIIKQRRDIVGYADNKEEAIEMIAKKFNPQGDSRYKDAVDWFYNSWTSYKDVYTFKEVEKGLK